MAHCPVCGADVTYPGAEFCTQCGAKLNAVTTNHCTNPSCPHYTAKTNFDKSIRHCPKCGSLTTIGKQIDDLI